MSGMSGSRQQAPGFYRFALGVMTGVAVHDGVLVRDRPPGFVRNAPEEAVSDAFATCGMPADKLSLTFTPLAVETADGVVLIDTGMGEAGPPGTGATLANLRAAGIAPEDVAAVIISHFHSDHINGLRTQAGAAVFPRATVHVPEREWAFWMDEARMAAADERLKPMFEGVRRIFGPGGNEVRHYAWGETIRPGFTAVQASGHTPGMSAIAIDGGSAQLLYVADVTNNPLIFARHPEWQAVFDFAPDEAVATRRSILDKAAAERQRLFFFHAPFPGLGTVCKDGEGYTYLPALWTGG